MLTQTRQEVEKLAAQAAEVEIFRFTQQDRYIRGIHTDNTASMDMKVSDLPDEFKGDVQLMDEEEYANTILANSSMEADFADWYGDKDAKVLVVVLSYESAEPLSEYWV
jgi:hypothetical protein